jgi:sigma-E factor negative regulatory protein RseA
MNEQEQISQLSALFDNELPPAQSEMVIRRALRDPALRASFGHYALIGACLRGEPVHGDRHQPDVAARVRSRLAAEVDHSRTAAQEAAAKAASNRSRFALLGRGALGGAIAAGVAVLSLVVVRSMAPAAPGVPLQLADVAASVNAAPLAVAQPEATQSAPAQMLIAARDAAPPSYTTPVDNSPAAQRLNGRLVNYVVAHSEVSASAVRFSPLSTVMSGDYDITQGAVEMTEAEIGALR